MDLMLGGAKSSQKQELKVLPSFKTPHHRGSVVIIFGKNANE